ncbi:MAG: NAD(P)-dependent oxidoreductase [Desulfobaccales bacterium]
MIDQLQDRKIALIGGAGFIGHNLALTLKQYGAQVSVIDGLNVNNFLWVHSNGTVAENRDLYLQILNQRMELLRAAGIQVFIQDARNYFKLSNILNQIKPEVIVHLAAIAHAKRSNKDPFSTFDHNLRTLENALDFAQTVVKHFIFFSSSMVYGNFLTPKVDEEHPLNPIGIYGALKLSGEKLVIAYQQVFGLPYTIIRPSALYGPRCISRRVIQIFIENALRGRKLRIDGDGSEKLDFTYIDDLVDGVCRAIANPASKNQVFNMTNGNARSILEMATTIKEYFPEVETEYVERDGLMPFRGTMSIDKAVNLLGYAPQNPLEVGMKKYIGWYRNLRIDAP